MRLALRIKKKKFFFKNKTLKIRISFSYRALQPQRSFGFKLAGEGGFLFFSFQYWIGVEVGAKEKGVQEGLREGEEVLESSRRDKDKEVYVTRAGISGHGTDPGLGNVLSLV